MKNTFPAWLQNELDKRGMTQAELARRSGITSAQISRILSGSRGAEGKTLVGIAKAFKLPPQIVYQAAGFLPPELDPDSLTSRADHLISTYKREETKQKAIEYLEYLAVQEEKGEYRVAPKKKLAHKPAAS